MDHSLETQLDLKDFLEEAELHQYYALFRDILKVTKLSQLKFVVTEDLVQIGLSKPEQRRYKKIYTKYFPNIHLTRIKKLLGASKKHEGPPRPTTETTETDSFNLEETSAKVPIKHIIPAGDITIDKELGTGEFGVVQQGTWARGTRKIQVAIKCLGQERMITNSAEFLKEAAVMHTIDHPNIVRLFGVVLHMDSLMLVTELAPLRSLFECLREVSLRLDFPVATLCDFAEQICDGMTYLENKRLIHRDLAVRNILVFNKTKVKISDFGLSRALRVGKDYYQTNYNVNLKLPVAWCAPECILYLKFTSASDVWAYAVCLWEMFSYGFQPWAGLSGHQILETIDGPNSQRLERPKCCPIAYYSLMLECWAHDPKNRPKFKDLGPRLRHIRPEQVQTLMQYCNQVKVTDHLDYAAGEIITVIGKESLTSNNMWVGVLPNGICGAFNPSYTKPCSKESMTASVSPYCAASITENASNDSNCSMYPTAGKSPLSRSDVKRHTYTGKKTIQRSVISNPQGDVKHTAHVGLDGACFGDISFLDPATCVPKQMVNSYKPAEDLEHVPLINPHSPSHMTGGASSTPVYLLLQDNVPRKEGEGCSQRTGNKKMKSSIEPSTSKSLFNKVRSATLGRSFKVPADEPWPTTSAAAEVHEYQEIADGNENAVQDNSKPRDDFVCRNSGMTNNAEFCKTFAEEIELLIKDLDILEWRSDPLPKLTAEQGITPRSYTLGKLDKKKTFPTSTMKAMSASEEKTLDTAVALANEWTTRSMTDLDSGGTHKHSTSPHDRSKFHFKFPLGLGSLGHSHGSDRDTGNKYERKNFSEEANSVPDIQATLTEESKLAYTSLIEEPSTSSLIPHMVKDNMGTINDRSQHGSMRKRDLGVPRITPPSTQIGKEESSLQANIANKSKDAHVTGKTQNALPLPPKSFDARLVDKPRHIRKYPLMFPRKSDEVRIRVEQAVQDAPPVDMSKHPEFKHIKMASMIYQNLSYQYAQRAKSLDGPGCSKDAQYMNLNSDTGANVPDKPMKEDLNSETNPYITVMNDLRSMNPFTNTGEYNAGPSNPFIPPPDQKIPASQTEKGKRGATKKVPSSQNGSNFLCVEELLKNSDVKPGGREKGIESDEVKIMCKILKEMVTADQCLEALELAGWNIHLAIKLLLGPPPHCD